MGKTFVRFLAIAISVFVASSAFAQDAVQQELADRAARNNQHSMSRFMPAPQVITEDRADYWLLIPAAGSLAGAQGTFFKSDVMITNHRSTDQIVDISWCQQGITCAGTGFSLQQITVRGNSFVFLNDIIGRLGPALVARGVATSGLGTLDLRARQSDGSLDTSAKIDAFSRIWTPMARAGGTIFQGGTTSQSFPSVRIDSLVGTKRAFVLGLQQDSNFRTNIGIYNDDLFTAHTFTIQVIGTAASTSYQMTVQPWTMNQGGIPAGNWGNLIVLITPDSGMGSENWAAYGSSTDNTTGDGWVSIASQND